MADRQTSLPKFMGGFSLLEIVISLGILSLVFLAINQLSVSSRMSSLELEAGDNLEDIKFLIRKGLNCTKTFTNPIQTPTGLLTLRRQNNSTLIAVPSTRLGKYLVRAKRQGALQEFQVEYLLLAERNVDHPELEVWQKLTDVPWACN